MNSDPLVYKTLYSKSDMQEVVVFFCLVLFHFLFPPSCLLQTFCFSKYPYLHFDYALVSLYSVLVFFYIYFRIL